MSINLMSYIAVLQPHSQTIWLGNKCSIWSGNEASSVKGDADLVLCGSEGGPHS